MPKLSDNQIGDRLHAALEAIGTNEGETIRGNTALVAARHSGARSHGGRQVALHETSRVLGRQVAPAG